MFICMIQVTYHCGSWLFTLNKNYGKKNSATHLLKSNKSTTAITTRTTPPADAPATKPIVDLSKIKMVNCNH